MTSWRAVSRRRVLTAGAVMLPLAATASCGVPEALRKPPGLSASVRTLRASITAEQALVDDYRTVIRRYPQLSGRLDSFLSQHQQHLTQLQSRLIVPPRWVIIDDTVVRAARCMFQSCWAVVYWLPLSWAPARL